MRLASLIIPLILFSFLGLSLSGCKTVEFDEPNPLPKGYTYHYSSEFNSAPGPELYSLGYEYSAEKNEAILTELRAAAIRLVSALEGNYDIKTDAVYMVPAGPHAQPFVLSFEHVLREVLTGRGYVLTASPAFALGLDFAIHPFTPGPETANHHRLNADIETPDPEPVYEDDIRLALGLFDEKGVIGMVEEIYHLPVYGYDKERKLHKFFDRVTGKDLDYKKWELNNE